MPLIVANWKMNKTSTSAEEYFNLLNLYAGNDVFQDVVFCPPILYHNFVDKFNFSLGAQDCSSFSPEQGSFTGEISALMLKDIGVKYVIVGHSERREKNLEQNNQIRQKITNLHQNGLIAILCVGESKEQRAQANYLQFIKKQLLECLPESTNIHNTVIAYEPIWSIGSGTSANISEIEEMHKHINQTIKILLADLSQNIDQALKIIYGGSVSKSNASDICKASLVSGLLVGGASLDPNEFYQIIINNR